MKTSARTLILVPVVSMIVVTLVAVSRSRPINSQPVSAKSDLADDSPESCITRLLAAERAGDLPAYLGCFSEQQQAKLRESFRVQSDRQTAAELQNRSAGLVGHAISDLKSTASDRTSFVLERIEKDHTARQRVEVQRVNGRWLITTLTTADWQRPAIPYGTAVFTPQRGAAQP